MNLPLDTVQKSLPPYHSTFELYKIGLLVSCVYSTVQMSLFPAIQYSTDELVSCDTAQYRRACFLWYSTVQMSMFHVVQYSTDELVSCGSVQYR